MTTKVLVGREAPPMFAGLADIVWDVKRPYGHHQLDRAWPVPEEPEPELRAVDGVQGRYAIPFFTIQPQRFKVEEVEIAPMKMPIIKIVEEP